MSDTIVVSAVGAVLTIALNRPAALNAFDDEMGAAFLDALESAREDSVRCVIIAGEGRAFCAGEDLRVLASGYREGHAAQLSEILRRRYNPAIEALISLRKPVVAAVGGVAAGAGVSLALACDHRVMAEEASFVLAFSKVGLVPDAGATWLLPRYLGIGRAMALAMSGDAVPAAKALELGLVDRVVPAGEVRPVAEQIAARFADGPTLAFGLIKKLIWGSGGNLRDHLVAEADAQGEAGRSADHLEGVNAFLDKRPPKFEGS